MKKILKIKTISLLLILTLTLTIFAVPAAAASADDEDIYEWDATTDENMVWNRDREYFRYELPAGYKVGFIGYYSFGNRVYMNGTNYSIISYARDGEIICLSPYSGYYFESVEDLIYVTDEGEDMLDAFISGTKGTAFIYSAGRCSELGFALVASLDAERAKSQKATVDVSELQVLNYYELRTYDQMKCVYYLYGALYEYEGEMWYLNYKELPNNYFDADGNFSYRSGTVELSKVGSENANKVIEAEENFEYPDSNVIYEDDEFDTSIFDSDTARKAQFWIVYALVALLLPCWPLAASIKAIRSPKHGRSKLWYIPIVGSILWIVLSIVVMILFITC